MKNLSKLLAITIFLVFGLFTAITSFPNQLDAAPPGNPPLANVSPIFTGLNVTGASTLESATVTNDLTVTGASTLDSATVTNDLTVSGRINRNTSTILGEVLTIPAAFNQPGDLFAGGQFSASNVTTRGNLVLTSAAANIINSGGENVNIADNLNVIGNVSSSGTLSVDTITSKSAAFVDIRSDLKNTSETGYACDCVKDIWGRRTCSTCYTDNPFVIDDGLTVNGHLKTNSIGSITVRKAFKSISPGNHDLQTVSCLINEIRLSCGGAFASNVNNVYLTQVGPDENNNLQCIASGGNVVGAPSNYTLQVYAVCLNPAG